MFDSTTRNLVIGFVGGALILGALAWIASPKGTQGTKEPTEPTVLTAEPTSYSFGTISMAKGVVTKTFTITNPSSAPITLSRLSTSCMCTNASLVAGDGQRYGPFGMEGHGYSPTFDSTIAAGGTVTVEVTFDPQAHGPAGVGYIERVVSLENSAGKPLKIPFSVTVTP